jgi:ABC-2 type transport system permease protein
MALDGQLEGYLVILPDVVEKRVCEYRGQNVSNIRLIEGVFQRSIKNVIVERQLTAEGLDLKYIKELNKPFDVKTIKVTKSGEKKTGFIETFFSSYVLIILLMMLILGSGQMLVRSLVEEKSNRIIEILVSSCSPTDLMAGKILGLSALGLTQIFVWLLFGFGIITATKLDLSFLEHLPLLLLYFILGYVFYTAIFVGMGSIVTTEQEAQQMTQYLTLLLVLPIVLAFPATQDPDSPLIRILSLIPVLTPTFMILRIPIQLPAMWEILATIGIMILFVILSIWAAAKVFRVGILVYGKRPNLAEIMRWIKA